MPNYKPYTKKHLSEVLYLIGDAVYSVVSALEIKAWWSREPLPYAQRFDGVAQELHGGDKWGDLFDCAWFNFTGSIPQSAHDQHVVLLLDVNGELCVVNENGEPVRGLTCVASTYDFSLGQPGKRVLQMSPKAVAHTPISIWADAGANDLFGNLQGGGTVKQAAIAVCHDEIRALYYDFEVLLDFLSVLTENNPRYQKILTGLNDVAHLCYASISDVAVEARGILAPLLQARGGDPSLHISAVGHAHMDLAWLWPIRETIREGARTFSTALELLDRYPDYVFGASQPQYFQWMKDHYPVLYQRIKTAVQQGRLEPQGAMWVEADTNLSGGEALVRQLLLGKRFFQTEFGVDIDYLWLPDVFGYNAALPQILQKAGVDYFSTQKLSWSLINHFPHQSFHWQGIDGTRILIHMLPEETDNSPAAPCSVLKIEQNYKDSGVSSYALMVFGIGDGGGGPGAEHLERLDRIKNLAGLSPVKQEPVSTFFKKWRTEAERFPTWVGELYLERHEGTLTTEARNKWYNRKMELGLRELEWTAVLNRTLAGADYPAYNLQTLWREVLLYQFHDILPGSSIKRVYDESLARYTVMYKDVKDCIAHFDAQMGTLVDTSGLTKPILIHNSLSWNRVDWYKGDKGWVHVCAPSMGYCVIDAQSNAKAEYPISASPTHLENDLLSITFNTAGAITSIFDKRERREVIASGDVANQPMVFHDPGDAWDFPMDYADQTPREMTLVSTQAIVDGPRACVKQVYALGYSILTQNITLTAGSPRLDFISHLHWRETRAMLRVRFPVAVQSEYATYEIQFGHITRPTHRNTTWDLARDEVAAHKWVDLSEGGYGVALLNDSKYGHKIKGNVIDLNLLRSVPYPGPCLVNDEDVAPGEAHHGYTDQCDHIFTYALYPHTGNPITGGVIQASYELNVPLRVVPLEKGSGVLPKQLSFITIDAPNIIVEAVKQAEDDSSTIIRLYEAANRTTRTNLSFGVPVTAVEEVTLLEKTIKAVQVQNNAITLTLNPFEIKTLKLLT